MDDHIRVTVIATGLDEKNEKVELPETQTCTPKKEVPSSPVKAPAKALSKRIDILTATIPKKAQAVKKTYRQKESYDPVHEKKDVPVAEPSAPAVVPPIESMVEPIAA